MKRDVFLWQFAGFVFATTLGTLLHFLFEWTGLISLAPIAAVNESTWEHMKILFFPMLIFAYIQARFFKADYGNFWWIKLLGICVSVMSIPIFFYTYSGAFGKTPDWLNIVFFFLSAGIGYLLEGLLLRQRQNAHGAFIAVIALISIAATFAAFTFFPPHLPLFQDPITGGYAIVN